MIRDSDEFAAAVADLVDSAQLEEALSFVRRGLRQFPGNRTLRFLEAVTLGKLGLYPSAKDILEELSKEAADEFASELIVELADVYLNLGRKRDAVSCIRNASRRADFDSDAGQLLAELLLDHGLIAESARCAAIAVRLDADGCGGWLSLGLALYRQARLSAAESCCRRVLAKSPKNQVALDLLGIIYFDLGRGQDAKNCWEQIPIQDHFDRFVLSAWRSLLKDSDPQVKRIRRRWKELRDDELKGNLIRNLLK
ncbi:MAG: tetratricopeptide repeat protein [Elusimicrobia bacterium]|nr:tetratricopeptide repeat protein [Elusimicrobiota bacterium]